MGDKPGTTAPKAPPPEPPRDGDKTPAPKGDKKPFPDPAKMIEGKEQPPAKRRYPEPTD